MAKKGRAIISRFESGNLSSGTNDDFTIPPSGNVANGKTIRIEDFGGSDVGSVDGVSSEIILDVSEDGGSTWDTIRRIAVTGSTHTERLGRTWRSNGSLRFRIRRRNNSGITKRVSAWCFGYRKESS